jgi:hypothetical protein
MTQAELAERARLISLLLHRGGERLAIEELANRCAEEGEPDDLAMCDAALDGDEEAWKSALLTDLLLQHPSLRGLVQSLKSEVQVAVVEHDAL